MPVLPAFGGKLNSTMRDLALGARGAAQRDQLGHARGQRRRPARCMARCMSRGLRRRRRLLAERPPKTIGPVAPSSSGMRHHHGGLDRQQAAVGALPLLQGLELDRVGREVGHVERGQHLLGGLASL